MSQDREPDYRFTLANERTFLAWIRTSLALLAGGVAVIKLVPDFSVAGGRHILGFALIGLSIVLEFVVAFGIKKLYDSMIAFRNEQYQWDQVCEATYDNYMIRKLRG